jgi:hypothetical protein
MGPGALTKSWTPRRNQFQANRVSDSASTPTGKSFKTTTIDLFNMFTVRDGKLAMAYYVQNWTGGVERIK